MTARKSKRVSDRATRTTRELAELRSENARLVDENRRLREAHVAATGAVHELASALDIRDPRADLAATLREAAGVAKDAEELPAFAFVLAEARGRG